MRRLHQGVTVVMVAGLIACADSTAPPEPGLEILFVSPVLGTASLEFANAEILAVSIDGTDLLNLTHSPGHDTDPRWSPQGDRVVFVSDYPDYDLHIMNADGSGRMTLTEDPEREYAPTWSPDGSRIAFTRFDPDRSDYGTDIFVVDPDGGAKWNVTYRIGNDDLPTWSPDGSHLAFTCRGTSWDDPAHVCVVRADGSRLDTLIADTLHTPNPSWSPDGSRIAYTCREGDGSEEVWKGRFFLCLAHVSESPVSDVATVRLPVEVLTDFGWRWSPDGSRILTEYRGDVLVINPDDGTSVNLTSNCDARSSAEPDWSPDGRQVVFASYHEYAWQLHMQSAVDSICTTRRLVTPIQASTPRWRPRGR
jgi:TolB protein